MTKYRVIFDDIVPVAVFRETPKFVWVKERDTGKIVRRRKGNGWCPFFDTWALAHDYLVREVIALVEGEREAYGRSLERLKKVEAMREPKSRKEEQG